MQRWHHQGEKWGEFVDARINSPQNVKREICHRRNVRIYLSSMTDCYQPVEKKYKLTRDILQVLLEKEKDSLFSSKNSITIQTKSSLIVRDLDLISQFKDLSVGFTITTLNDEYARIFEPGATPPLERIEALEKINKANIQTYVFFGPILPGISDSFKEMHKILTTIYNAGTKKVLLDKLNYFSYIRALKEIAFGLKLFESFKQTAHQEYAEELKSKILTLQNDFPSMKLEIVF
jgi:DNA repair photolyase